jgi:hypothetical protein
MDDEEETDLLTQDQAQSVLGALEVLRANLAAASTERTHAGLATALVTQATRQVLIGMAAALEPVDRGEGMSPLHAEVAGRTWAILAVLGPVFMKTLPAKYHF